MAVIAAFLLLRSSSPKSDALEARENAMEELGEEIARTRPGCKVLVLSNPFSRQAGFRDEKKLFESAGLRGLRKGLGRQSSVTVVSPEIKPEYFANPQSVFIPSDSRTPLSFLIRPGSVEQLAEAHPDNSVIVSLIGLPVGIDQEKIWTQDKQRSFALLLPDLRLLGGPEKVIEAFQRGKLLAVVTEDLLRSGRPLIVTRENIVEILERQPKALGY